MNSRHHTYTYDSKGNRTLYLIEDWDGGKWINMFRYTFAYDSKNNRTLYFTEHWDSDRWISSW
ncbi:MAG: hypothetical protein L3J41_06420 [Melioribacteraceae bacterium]|nr:hypothetical protein [Melioribacteraceae bacterium]